MSNLPYGATRQMLKSLFGPYGFLIKFNVQVHGDYATVTYEEEHSAWAAIAWSKERGIHLKGFCFFIVAISATLVQETQ